MGRKIFKEYNFNVAGKVISKESLCIFSDRETGFSISKECRDKLLSVAEGLIGKTYPNLLATEYMMFRRNGDRSVFQKPYFERRHDMLRLALAEYIEGKGRFIDSIINLVWMILEETTWVLPAHNRVHADGKGTLSYSYAEEVDYIDLFSAATGAELAWVIYLCKDALNNESEVICERVVYELERRIIKPYLDDSCTENDGWNGKRGHVNNWCPWIVSNILNIVAFTVNDMSVREAAVSRALEALDCFTDTYHEDGGCDEGPSYWQKAGGALFNACLVLYDITGGYIDVFKDPLIVRMCEYIAKVNISGDSYINFSDAKAKLIYKNLFGYDWALLSGSRVAENFWRYKLSGCGGDIEQDGDLPYRYIRQLGFDPLTPPTEYTPPLRVWLDGICVAVTREKSSEEGLFLAIKGGHNAESHNHNDVGNFIVYADGSPIFIDAGVGEYTKRTFGKDRYTIWSMCSEYHNTASFSGVGQLASRSYEARDPIYDEKTGALSLDLTAAYPTVASLISYRREAVLSGGQILITDRFTLSRDGDVAFNLMTNKAPEDISDNGFVINGRKISFDSRLRLEVEEVKCDTTETRDIPKAWGTDAIYRIRLLADVLADRENCFVISIK